MRPWQMSCLSGIPCYLAPELLYFIWLIYVACDKKLNSLWPGRFLWNFRWVLFKPITVIDGWDTCCEIALRKMSLDLTDDQLTLVQVMAWYHQAPSHYLSQCWPRSLSPYGVTRPHWVNVGQCFLCPVCCTKIKDLHNVCTKSLPL